VWTLTAAESAAGGTPPNPEPARYLNRLSDLLFVMARVLARHENGTEVIWRRDRGAGPG
jgi:cob(I)alamin adenosyltransferase